MATIVSTLRYIIFMSMSSKDWITEAKFLVHDRGNIVDSSMKLLYRPASRRSLAGRTTTLCRSRLHPPSQGLKNLAPGNGLIKLWNTGNTLPNYFFNTWIIIRCVGWMQGWCVPDRCVPDRKFLDVAPLEQSVPWILCPWPMCPDPGPRSVSRYRGLSRPPAPNGSVGRLAGFAYAPDQVYLLAPLRRMHTRPTHRTPPLRSAKARGSWKSGVALLNQIKGMGWFGQGQISQGTLCPRDATFTNFKSGTHRSGMD